MSEAPEIKKRLMVVCNPEHSHFGCTGYLSGQMIKLFGKPLAGVRADNCKHMADGFFVSSGDLKEVSDVRR